jgi:hypothetical protein
MFHLRVAANLGGSTVIHSLSTAFPPGRPQKSGEIIVFLWRRLFSLRDYHRGHSICGKLERVLSTVEWLAFPTHHAVAVGP